MTSLSTQTADAIVVGAGLAGGWAAKELASGGMKVALLDAGPVLPESNFSINRSQTDLFNPRYHLFRLKLLLRGQTDQALSRFMSRETYKLFLDRRKESYVTAAGRDFRWFRVRAVGGRGHLWGRVMLRVTDQQLCSSGFAWPLRYKDLSPYYSEIEKLLAMGGAPSGTSEVPDGEYVHARSLNPLEQQFCDAVRHRWPERRTVVNHVAQYEPAPLSPMLKVAFATGNLRLFANKVAASLEFDAAGKNICGVVTVDAKSLIKQSFRAPYVILAASAFETVRILLNSKSKKFPNGVGNGNGLVGSRILEHVTATISNQLPPSVLIRNSKYVHNPFKLNAEPHGFYMPPFASFQRSNDSCFGYGVQGTISPYTGVFYLGAFGETVPSDGNRLRLHPTQRDQYGIPIAIIDFSLTAEDVAMWKDASSSLLEMAQAFSDYSGIDLVNPLTNQVYNMLSAKGPPSPGSNHECGGARMGIDASSSVVDGYNRVWETPNVLVCDSACFPSIPHQNPTLTTMALAVRATRNLLAVG